MYHMEVSVHKLENFAYGLDCDISERGIYSGTGSPIADDEVKDIDSKIEEQRKGFEKRLGEKVVIVFTEDARVIQQQLF